MINRPPPIPGFDYELDWLPAVRAAAKAIGRQKGRDFLAQAGHARNDMLPMMDAALRSYVVSNYQKRSRPPLSALLPKLRGKANGNPTKPDPYLDKFVQLEIDRAARNTESDDVQEHARQALRFVESKIAIKETRQARHAADKDLDRLISSFNSAWIEGFDYELPSYTPGTGRYPAFLYSVIFTYASRLPDEYWDAKVSLLVLAEKRTAIHKRFKRSGIPKLNRLFRKWAKDIDSE